MHSSNYCTPHSYGATGIFYAILRGHYLFLIVWKLHSYVHSWILFWHSASVLHQHQLAQLLLGSQLKDCKQSPVQSQRMSLETSQTLHIETLINRGLDHVATIHLYILIHLGKQRPCFATIHNELLAEMTTGLQSWTACTSAETALSWCCGCQDRGWSRIFQVGGS